MNKSWPPGYTLDMPVCLLYIAPASFTTKGPVLYIHVDGGFLRNEQ